MSYSITEKGWLRTTIERFEIKTISRFQTVEKWVDFHERNPGFKGNGRRECSCCGKPWKDIKTGNVWICMMVKKVNQCICDKCAEEYERLRRK